MDEKLESVEKSSWPDDLWKGLSNPFSSFRKQTSQRQQKSLIWHVCKDIEKYSDIKFSVVPT